MITVVFELASTWPWTLANDSEGMRLIMRVTDSVSVEPEGVHKSVDQDDIEYDQVQSSFFANSIFREDF